MKYSSLSAKLVTGLVLFLAVGTVWVNNRRGLSTSLSNGQLGFSHSDAPAPLSGKVTGANLAARITTDTRQDAKTRVTRTYGKLPLSFEANQGQVDRRVKFLSRGTGYGLFFTSTEAVLQFSTADSRSPSENGKAFKGQSTTVKRRSSTLRMKLVGANPTPHVRGLNELEGKSNYFIGNNPRKWHSAVPNYAKVKYENVYPGIDLVYYGNQRQLEYDFVLAPGAEPEAIQLSFQGADKIDMDTQGDLILTAGTTTVCQHKPKVYQNMEGVQREIPGSYVLNDKRRVAFRLAA